MILSPSRAAHPCPSAHMVSIPEMMFHAQTERIIIASMWMTIKVTRELKVTCHMGVEKLHFLSFLKTFYLFIFREGKGGRKKGREISMCVCLSHGPHWGTGPQPRHVPPLGIEAARAQSTGLRHPGRSCIFIQVI